MKRIALCLGILFLISCNNNAQNKTTATAENITTMTENDQNQTVYQFKIKDIEGKDFDLASLKGKKIMIVNTASECGLTPQYEQLQSLYQEFKDKNFVIVGFPANNFGSQEPGTNQDIAAFCSKNYGVSFPMMEKISVKGDDIHPLYQFLTQKSKNGLEDSTVEWNFQKFLIGEDGKLARVVSSRTLPNAVEIKNWIKGVNAQ